jgi:hypothetical protein
MKKLLKALVCVATIVSLQSFAIAQKGYSITDNDQDVAPFLDQQFYSIDLATGLGTLLDPVRTGPGAAGHIQREYEGFASIGSTLYAVPEFATLAGEFNLCNTGSDPVSGLSVDLRTFRTDRDPATGGGLAYPLANGITTHIGPQIGETCIDFGTESALGYNAVDGYFYSIASDDLIVPGTPPLGPNAVRSRLYRISPTTGLAVRIIPTSRIGAIDSEQGIILTPGSALPPDGSNVPYLDGMTCLANSNCYATEARFNRVVPANSATAQGSFYRVFTTGGNAGTATFIKVLFPGGLNSVANTPFTGGVAQDTGLANLGNTIYLLLERRRVFTTSVAAAGAVNPTVWNQPGLGQNEFTTPGCLSIATLGQCRDFEGFDIPANSTGLSIGSR